MRRPTSLLCASLALVGLAPALAGQGKASFMRTNAPLVRTLQTNNVLTTSGNVGGLAVDDQGRIYVANFGTRVRRIEKDGRVRLLSNSFAVASGNSIDNSGNLLQSDFNRNQLVSIDENGVHTLLASTGLSGPVGNAMDAAGNIYVLNCGNNTIARIDPALNVTQFSASPLLNCPNGIVIDELGDIYVVNFNDDLLLRFDAGGAVTVLGAVGSGNNNAHIALANGKLYIAKIFNHQIWEVTRTGQAKLLVGTGVRGSDDGFGPHQATLSLPNGMGASPDGRFVYTNTLVGAQLGGAGGQILVRSVRLP